MPTGQYPTDVQFAGLIQAATAAADAQHQNASVLGKRRRSQDDSVIDTQLRGQNPANLQVTGQLPPSAPILQSSASILFREPSEKSKKYSRPPLGKVYTDLELAPESFLRLQNAAKLYMLDENHMERRDVVGHKKHSSNNDVAKLRLWNCVEDFLMENDNGEEWFGHDSGLGIPDAPQRTFFWPEDKHKITKLCMPLFRKMVTNERQRIYASETRRHDAHKGEKNQKADASTEPSTKGSPMPQTSADESPSVGQDLGVLIKPKEGYATSSSEQQKLGPTDRLILHVNVVSVDKQTSQRVVPKFSIPSESLTTLSQLTFEARKRYDSSKLDPALDADSDEFLPVVKVWLPEGLVRIKHDGEWMVALLTAANEEWMDSEVRVLIEV